LGWLNGGWFNGGWNIYGWLLMIQLKVEGILS
jgi:hypothetical protein